MGIEWECRFSLFCSISFSLFFFISLATRIQQYNFSYNDIVAENRRIQFTLYSEATVQFGTAWTLSLFCLCGLSACLYSSWRWHMMTNIIGSNLSKLHSFSVGAAASVPKCTEYNYFIIYELFGQSIASSFTVAACPKAKSKPNQSIILPRPYPIWWPLFDLQVTLIACLLLTMLCLFQESGCDAGPRDVLRPRRLAARAAHRRLPGPRRWVLAPVEASAAPGHCLYTTCCRVQTPPREKWFCGKVFKAAWTGFFYIFYPSLSLQRREINIVYCKKKLKYII